MNSEIKPKAAKLFQLMFQIPGQFYLWMAALIFGASSAVTRKITEIGAQNFVGGENPISLCNVLFVGNLCALIVFLMIHRKLWRRVILSQISRSEWLSLFLIAVLSGALAPGLIFQALSLTPVTNVVLIGRLEPPLTLALSIWLLHDRVNRWSLIGAIIAFMGVVLTVLLHPDPSSIKLMGGMLPIGLGELLAILGAIVLSAATIIGKKQLHHVPLGISSIVRTGLGTLVFFVVALLLYGHDHFAHAFSPFLWKWMLLYGFIIVVVGQSFWSAGLRVSSVATASIIGSFTPIAGIIAAYVLLGETPTQAQYAGASVILLGLLFSQIGIHHQSSRHRTKKYVASVQGEQAISTEIGFKGI